MDYGPLWAAVLLFIFSLKHSYWVENNINWFGFLIALSFFNFGIFVERNFIS